MDWGPVQACLNRLKTDIHEAADGSPWDFLGLAFFIKYLYQGFQNYLHCITTLQTNSTQALNIFCHFLMDTPYYLFPSPIGTVCTGNVRVALSAKSCCVIPFSLYFKLRFQITILDHQESLSARQQCEICMPSEGYSQRLQTDQASEEVIWWNSQIVSGKIPADITFHRKWEQSETLSWHKSSRQAIQVWTGVKTQWDWLLVLVHAKHTIAEMLFIEQRLVPRVPFHTKYPSQTAVVVSL